MFLSILGGYFLVASLVTFLAYAFDKSAARNETRRTRERTLLVLGLIGGWPGAVAAQRVLRHKTRKTAFRRRFLLTVVLNCVVAGLFVWQYFQDWQVFTGLGF